MTVTVAATASRRPQVAAEPSPSADVTAGASSRTPLRGSEAAALNRQTHSGGSLETTRTEAARTTIALSTTVSEVMSMATSIPPGGRRIVGAAEDRRLYQRV